MIGLGGPVEAFCLSFAFTAPSAAWSRANTTTQLMVRILD